MLTADPGGRRHHADDLKCTSAASFTTGGFLDEIYSVCTRRGTMNIQQGRRGKLHSMYDSPTRSALEADARGAY